MTTNSIAISRNLVAAGLELTAANAIAEVVVTNADETTVTKADFVELKASTKADLAKMEAATKADLVKVETATKENLVKMEAEIKSLVTKADLTKVETEIKAEIAELRTDVKVLSTKVDSMESSIQSLRHWVYGIFFVIVANMLMGYFS